MIILFRILATISFVFSVLLGTSHLSTDMLITAFSCFILSEIWVLSGKIKERG